MKSKTYIYKHELTHYGIPGQKWGVRRNLDDDIPKSRKRGLSDQEKQERRKTIKTVAAGAAIGAAVVGAAWYAKNLHGKKILRQRKAAIAAKAKATRAVRKASGYYETFKNVDVVISNGSGFMKSFANVKVAKILV